MFACLWSPEPWSYNSPSALKGHRVRFSDWEVELDNFYFVVCVSKRERLSYESEAPERGTPLDVEGSARVCARYSSLLALLQFFFMSLGYIEYATDAAAGNYQDEGGEEFDRLHWYYHYWQIGASMYVHGGVHAMAGVHLVIRRIAHKRAEMLSQSYHGKLGTEQLRTARLGLAFDGARLLLSAFVMLASAFAANRLIFQGLTQLLGYTNKCSMRPSEPSCPSRHLLL